MFQKLVNRNDDIRRLLEKGYAIAFDSNCLIVRDIPYLDGNLKLQIGAIVTKLVFVDQEKVSQDDHQILFAGSTPHGLDAKPIPNLGGGPTSFALSPACNDVVVQRLFSNKPRETGRFQDFFEKIESYVNIISGPAIELHRPNPYPFTFRAIKEIITDTIFKFHDTLTTRAEIGDLSAKFKDDIVAVIGLGGTGSYLMDFLVKTPVREIRGFDHDSFYVHNGFRSPGKIDETEFGKTKAEVYLSRHSNFRTGLSIIPKRIDQSCADDLKGVTFAFVCVDKGLSRSGIFDVLISMGIPYIDVGMGLNRKKGPIDGMLRTTYYSIAEGKQTLGKNLAPLADQPNDVYRNNIQIGELNALNACLAMIKFKQLRGFYFEETPFYHLTFKVGDFAMIGLSKLDEN